MDIVRTIALRFEASAVEAETHVNLSAVRTDSHHLWIAGDETATVERLTCDDPDRPAEYRDHVSFSLAETVPLPGEAHEEVDIEVSPEVVPTCGRSVRTAESARRSNPTTPTPRRPSAWPPSATRAAVVFWPGSRSPTTFRPE